MPPNTLDLEDVAVVVLEAMSKNPKASDITTRGWFIRVSLIPSISRCVNPRSDVLFYCKGKEYILDIVSIYALMDAKNRILQVPTSESPKHLDDVDLVSKYLALEEPDDDVKIDLAK